MKCFWSRSRIGATNVTLGRWRDWLLPVQTNSAIWMIRRVAHICSLVRGGAFQQYRRAAATDLLANGLAQLLAVYSVGRPAGDHQVQIPGRLIMKGIPDIVVKKSSHMLGIAFSRNGNICFTASKRPSAETRWRISHLDVFDVPSSTSVGPAPEHAVQHEGQNNVLNAIRYQLAPESFRCINSSGDVEELLHARLVDSSPFNSRSLARSVPFPTQC